MPTEKMRKVRPPTRHHFSPVFYLKRWAGDDGCVEQFTKPNGTKLNARRLPPSATGFSKNLYTMLGADPEVAQEIETKFMQEVDSKAALVLAQLESGGQIDWTSENRSAWTRFIESLQLRTPADIRAMVARTRHEWGQGLEEVEIAYKSAVRGPNDPETFVEFLRAKDPFLADRVAMNIATKLIDHAEVGKRINALEWAVLDLSASSLSLLTSDRPVEQCFGLGDARCFISLPIGPTRLFVAANQSSYIRRFIDTPPREVVRLRNKTTVALARDYIWASDRTQQNFIDTFFGVSDAPTLGERLARLATEA